MRYLAAAALCFLLSPGCSGELTVEQQIIETLHEMEEAAESGQHFDFMAFVAEDFRGQDGRMERREFHRYLLFQINQHRRFQAQFLPIFVSETGEQQASAHFRILVTGGGSLLPESGQLFEVETHWRRGGGDWTLVRADWDPVYIEDVL